ncbi:hypothetical protein BN903_5 [Halorubrum sp. AJ67]|nr:hypothetical protein BN903_5 [Halorubrum sp. AJ67]
MFLPFRSRPDFVSGIVTRVNYTHTYESCVGVSVIRCDV